MTYYMQYASNKNPITLIKTNRLILKTPDIEHSHLIFDSVKVSAEDIYPWLPWATKNITIEDIEGYINYFIKCQNSEKPSSLFFDIWDNGCSRYLGSVYFGQIEWRNPSFSVGYWLDSRERNNGYMVEAVNAISHVAFRYFKANRVEIKTSKNNVSAKRIPEKLNFELEAEFANHHINYFSKEISSTLVYACVDNERLPDLLGLKWYTKNQGNTDLQKSDDTTSHNEIINWANEILSFDVSEVEIIVETAWSCVIKINLKNESVYLKQTPKDLFLEAEIIKLLRNKCGIKTIPDIIAANTKMHCFLMTKCGDISLRTYFDGNLQIDVIKQAIVIYRKLQKSTAGFINELIALGVPDWRLDKFPALYQQLIANSKYLAEYGLTAKQQAQLHSYGNKVKILCEELVSFKIDECLNHSDFHDNNIVYDKNNKTIAIVDLGETSINHPLFSLRAFLEATKNRYNLDVDSAIYRALQEYAFSDFLIDELTLSRALEIITILLPVYLLFTQKRFLDAINLPYNDKDSISVKQHDKINKGFIWFIDNMEADAKHP